GRQGEHQPAYLIGGHENTHAPQLCVVHTRYYRKSRGLNRSCGEPLDIDVTSTFTLHSWSGRYSRRPDWPAPPAAPSGITTRRASLLPAGQVTTVTATTANVNSCACNAYFCSANSD